MGGPLQQLLGISQEQRAVKAQQEQQKIRSLSELLDNPDITIDAKEHIATQLEDLTNVDKKKRGTLPLLTRIFHAQQQEQKQPSQMKGIFGNVDEFIPDTPAGPGSAPQTNPETGSVDWLAAMGTPPSESGQRRGSMTTRQLQSREKLDQFGQEQGIKAKYDAENDERTRQRQLEVQRVRGEQAATRVAQGFEQKKIFLGLQGQQRARKEIDARIAAGATPEAAAQDVLEKFGQEEELRTQRQQYLKAVTAAIPEKLRMEGERVAQGWQRLDVQDIHNQFMEDVAKGRGDVAQANLEIQPLLAELRSTRDEIEYFNKFDPSTDKTGAMAGKLKQARDYESNLLNHIWQVKGKYTSQPAPERKPPTRGSSTPSRGSESRGGKYVAPKVSAQRLQELMQ